MRFVSCIRIIDTGPLGIRRICSVPVVDLFLLVFAIVLVVIVIIIVI